MTHSLTTDPSAATDVEVGAAMHRGVLAARATAAPRHVAAMMAANEIHAVVVSDVGPARVRTDLDVIASVLAGHVTVHRSETGFPEVGVHEPLSAAVAQMVRRDCSHILVSEGGSTLPVGVVSSFDVAAVVAGREPRIARMARPTAARPALSESRLDRLVVGDVMHVGVIAVAPETALRDLAGVLADRRIHAVSVAGIAPAGAGGRLVWAVATDLDVVRSVADGTLEATAREIAAAEPLIVDVTTPLDAAAHLLVEHDVSHAIVAEQDAAIGVLSTLDVLRAVAVGSW